MRHSAVPFLCALLMVGCSATGPSAGQPTTEMADVLAERAAMHPRESADISLQEARDVPSLVEAAYAINNDQGLPASIVEIDQFNQPDASGAAGPIGATAVSAETGEEHAGHHLFPVRHLGDATRRQ